MFRPLIVAAPFGNYLGRGWATRTLGTFTLFRRPPGNPIEPVSGGRLWRILKTVRYNPFHRSWRNKIGLRNPGISSLFKDPSETEDRLTPKRSHKDHIISIHGFHNFEWSALGAMVARCWPAAIELNLSCPNVQCIDEPLLAFEMALQGMGTERRPVIVKLPPPSYGMEALAEGTAQIYRDLTGSPPIFHCCNTIPTPKGGISGRPLKKLAIRGVRWLRREFPTARIIGGGGVTSLDDYIDLRDAGADHVAIASCLFFPWNAFWRMPRMSKGLKAR